MSNQISISTLFELYYFIHKPGALAPLILRAFLIASVLNPAEEKSCFKASSCSH